METESDAANFRSLFEQTEKELVRVCIQKEKELVGICEQQVKHLQQQVFDRDKNIADLNTKLCSIKEDFKYNLELLDGRDAELSQYELELSALQDSAKQAAKNIQEAHQKLVESEFQRLQDKSRAEEKDKLYQRTLLDMKQQMESLQLTREQLLGLHKQAFETSCADLKSEVEKQQIDMERHSKMLEAQTCDKIRIHELQSQIVLDGVKNKLSVAETTMKQMEKERDAAEQEYLQTETELRDIIKERDKTIQQISTEMKQLQSEMDKIKAIGDLKSRKSEDKLQRLEVEHQQQMSQMKSEIGDLQKRFESAESRLTACGEQPAQINGFLGKVGQLEKEMMAQEKEMNMKLHGVEAFIREAAQHQDQQVQELRTQLAWWKAQHDVLLSKYTTQQKQLAEGSTNEEVAKNLTFLQAPFVETIGKKQDALATSYNFESTRPNISNVFLPQSQLGKGHSGTSNSLGSSLPSPSPLPSPVFSNFEETLHLGTVNERVQTNTQEDDLVKMDVKDDNMPHPFEKGDEDAKLMNLAKENQGLRKSVQNLKDQNVRMRLIVGMMRTDMETLQKATQEKAQKATLEKAPKSISNIEELSAKCDNEEIRQLRDEVHVLASEIQHLRHKKSEASPDQNYAQVPNQAIEAIQEKNNEFDRTKSIRASNDSQQSAPRVAELERVQRVLRMQLQSATADLIRMTDERDCLMEISNSLHADFNRFVQQPNLEQSTLSPRNRAKSLYIHPTMNMAKSSGKETTPLLRPHTSPPKMRGGTQMQDQRLETSPSRGSKQGTNIHTQSKNMQPKEDVDDQIGSRWLHLEGKMQSLKERPAVTQDYVHKGIPSQLHKLEKSTKRREAQIATQMARRPRVRNYNIKDDDLAFQ